MQTLSHYAIKPRIRHRIVAQERPTLRKIIPVIMSGGAGSRLWPLSSSARPKQFHTIAARRTMIQETADRVRDPIGGVTFTAPIVIASAAHEDLISDQLQAIGIEPALLVLEPEGRNTAATAALAAFAGDEVDPTALVLLLPADHLIEDRAAFAAAIRAAAGCADARIVTFGVTPTGPETGYGYIQAGATLTPGVLEVTKFHEKPHADLAATYAADPRFSWNAGIFLFRPGLLLDEFTGEAAAIREAVAAAWFGAKRDGRVVRLESSHFSRAPKAPIDTAVMEKTAHAAVAPVSMAWADVGSWSEVWRLSPKDEAGNVVSGDVVFLDGADSLVRSEGVKLAVCGVNDLIIVATRDGVVVAPKSRAQDVKLMVEAWNKRGA
jgi:mannose-1-phosphate guanylyltransferase/mannose-6-phosphate isomerase